MNVTSALARFLEREREWREWREKERFEGRKGKRENE
jgi:hypothetical protein